MKRRPERRKMTETIVESLSITSFSQSFDSDLINIASYDLFDENHRLASFQNNMWINEFVNADELARVGFYFYKKPDVVKCYFCDIAIRDFEEGDTPIAEHIKWSPNCPLILRRVTPNIPIDEELLNQILPPISYDTCGFSSSRRKSNPQDEVKYPDFKLISQRMKSFETWPVGIKQRPKELSEAGFFYSGQSDVVICFACGIVICKWEPTDNVWVEHKKHLQVECSFLKRNHETMKLQEEKYEEFKKLPKLEVQSATEDAVESPLPSPSNSIKYESLCKICLERKSSVLFLPCKHVAVCGQCVFGIEKDCPICRTKIDEKINLYYA